MPLYNLFSLCIAHIFHGGEKNMSSGVSLGLQSGARPLEPCDVNNPTYSLSFPVDKMGIIRAGCHETREEMLHTLST